ncbi:hypothetical protein IWW34DRAFT_791976 [Fusarium oxysporum f. sp. albedinis]|nr:hypothetical protein IWW34DRAFT_791976 [Fusarium oxysporum f. sp. albedinis]
MQSSSHLSFASYASAYIIRMAQVRTWPISWSGPMIAVGLSLSSIAKSESTSRRTLLLVGQISTCDVVDLKFDNWDSGEDGRTSKAEKDLWDRLWKVSTGIVKEAEVRVPTTLNTMINIRD